MYVENIMTDHLDEFKEICMCETRDITSNTRKNREIIEIIAGFLNNGKLCWWNFL